VVVYESCTDDRRLELIDMTVISVLSMDFKVESMLAIRRSALVSDCAISSIASG
jgi:hypothetical protein